MTWKQRKSHLPRFFVQKFKIVPPFHVRLEVWSDLTLMHLAVLSHAYAAQLQCLDLVEQHTNLMAEVALKLATYEKWQFYQRREMKMMTQEIGKIVACHLSDIFSSFGPVRQAAKDLMGTLLQMDCRMEILAQRQVGGSMQKVTPLHLAVLLEDAKVGISDVSNWSLIFWHMKLDECFVSLFFSTCSTWNSCSTVGCWHLPGLLDPDGSWCGD